MPRQKNSGSLSPGRFTIAGLYGPGPNGGIIVPMGDKMAVLGEGDGAQVMSKQEYEAYLARSESGANKQGWGNWGGSWANAKGMKDGGVVRGCGKAERGRTRGKMR